LPIYNQSCSFVAENQRYDGLILADPRRPGVFGIIAGAAGCRSRHGPQSTVRKPMNLTRLILIILVAVVPSRASAQTVSFEQATAMLAGSCGADIDNVCRGVNLDPARLRECLRRNDDGVSPKCRDDYPRAFSAIDQRVSARASLSKLCNWEMKHLCGEAGEDPARRLQCLLDSTRKATANCNKAISAAGYR
jgi:hypothetical protein